MIKQLDATEILALVFLICGLFTLLVFDALSNYEPYVSRPPKTDIQLMPQRDCGHLTGERWVDCMMP